MKEIKRRELELLAKLCKQDNLPLKLAMELIRSAEKYAYENNTQGARIDDYHKLIKHYTKDISQGEK